MVRVWCKVNPAECVGLRRQCLLLIGSNLSGLLFLGCLD